MKILSVMVAVILSSVPVSAAEVSFPEKLDRAGFHRVIADVGSAYIAGQPTEDALRVLAAEGVTVVVSLRTPHEMDTRTIVSFDEKALVEELGMTYIHIPLGGHDFPYTPEAVDRFAQVMKATELAGSKLLLHCTVAWRASHMWAAYLMREKGMTLEDATRHARAINLGDPPLEGLLGVRLGYKLLQE